MGQMIRENIILLTRFKKYWPKILILQMTGCMFGKAMPVNRYTAAASLCHFYKVTFMLP